MLDVKLLRTDIAQVATRLKIKNFELDIALYERLEEARNEKLLSDYVTDGDAA